MEIERKFIPTQIPDNLHRYEKKEVMQGYISSDPELRLRHFGNKYIFTFKNGSYLAREEFEIEISKEQFENLWKLVSGNIIKKDRYYIPLEKGLIAELDIYHEHLNGLITVEVEFDSEDGAKAFVPPDWFGEDVTYDKRYSNINLSQGPPPSLIKDD